MAELSFLVPKSKKSKSKKHNPKSTTTADSTIHEHALFFDKLIELIPPKFYIGEEEKSWFQGLSKAKKAKQKKKTKENTKKARRERFDPGIGKKSTLDLLKERFEKEKKGKEGKGFDVGGLAEEEEEETERVVTHEELRERFRRKLEELRGGRSDNVNQGKKRKRDDGRPSRKEGTNVGEKGKEKEEKKVEERDVEKEELERALKTEEEAKTDPEVAKKQAWKVAMDRAKGIKVHDDPRKLKESIKKEGKKHRMSKEKWEGRVESVETKRKERQEKRKENVKAKIEQKKMRKIEKREKKLMRPGFEGRKEGLLGRNLQGNIESVLLAILLERRMQMALASGVHAENNIAQPNTFLNWVYANDPSILYHPPQFGRIPMFAY
ncbi:Surfeit locus protein 6-like protein [Drosera capensis]